jgi:hypothetical protein
MTCEPCITIRQIIRIIYINLVDTYKNIEQDIKAYRMINATVCVLDKPVTKELTVDEALEKVRKLATEHRSKDLEAQA